VTGYRYHHRVTFDETNLVGNVYFAHYLHWQGHCREQFLFDHAPGVVSDLQEGLLALVTVSCSMSYHDEAFVGDEIEVAMTPDAVGGSRLGMDFSFRRGDRLLASGTQSVACMVRSADGLRPVPLPAELRTAVARYR
jgi:enediyne biosynthesis thioesterase